MQKPRKQAQTLGRPAGNDGDRVKSELLQAARKLFLSSEFKAVSIREIAASAGVNGAMVSYYFGGKQGLYLAMVEELLQSLQQSLQPVNPDADVSVEAFSYSYCKLLAENPWWPNFMVREVLFSDGEIRAAVLQKFTAVFAPRLLQSIEHEKQRKNYREDLNSELTLMSLMGMTIFPFLAKPLVEKAFKLKIDETIVTQLASHNAKLFLHGVGATNAKAAQEKQA